MTSESSSIADMLSIMRLGDAERRCWLYSSWLTDAVELFMLDPIESLDILRYACFSHNVFQA